MLLIGLKYIGIIILCFIATCIIAGVICGMGESINEVIEYFKSQDKNTE